MESISGNTTTQKLDQLIDQARDRQRQNQEPAKRLDSFKELLLTELQQELYDILVDQGFSVEFDTEQEDIPYASLPFRGYTVAITLDDDWWYIGACVDTEGGVEKGVQPVRQGGLADKLLLYLGDIQSA